MKALATLLLISFASLASARVGTHQGHRFEKAERGLRIKDEYVVTLPEGTEITGLLRGLMNGGNSEDMLYVYEDVVKGFTIRMKLKALTNKLKNYDGVTITENSRVEVDTTPVPTPGMLTGSPWGLDRCDQRSADLNTTYSWERDGSNVDVYVLDTGIYWQHTDFDGRARFGKDFMNEGDGDGDGHGTHVAGKFDLLLFGICHCIRYLTRP
jgi:subtilisin family serine protease